MTMKVLSRQQFDVLGSTKVPEWTTSIPSKRQKTATIESPPPPQPPRRRSLAIVATAATAAAAASSAADTNTAAHDALTRRLQTELRAAKQQHMAGVEVLLPCDLLRLVAGEMLHTAELEPCGIRGCRVYVDYDDQQAGDRRRIAAVQLDAGTVPTFELYLELRRDRSGGWTSMLPQFLKNIARNSSIASSSTIMISPDFVLNKRKLYNSFSD